MTATRVPMEAEAQIAADRPFDASDPKQVNDARKKAGRKKKSRMEFIEAMMSVPEGRRWVWEEMEACSVFGNPLVHGGDGHIDPLATHFKLGEQNRGKKLLADVQQFPDYYVAMVREATTEK